MTTVNCAYRFALDPTPTQQRALLSHAGASRVAYNWALALVKANISQRAAEKTYGLSGDQLTPGQVALKRQPGTATAGKTGTGTPQGEPARVGLTQAN
ncbi:MAG: helix-turn-helix domain-containing protein [Pseudonocardiales bacterium]